MASAPSVAPQEKQQTQIPATARPVHDPELARWQRRLLPIMTLFVIALAVTFFVFSTRTLSGVGDFVRGEHGELREHIEESIKNSGPPKSSD